MRVSSGETRFLLKSEQDENRDEDDEAAAGDDDDHEDDDESKGTTLFGEARGLPGPEHVVHDMDPGSGRSADSGRRDCSLVRK